MENAQRQTKHSAQRGGSYLVWYSRGQGTPLICFPHAGATAGIYRTWQRELGAEYSVIGVQLPGRANRLQEPLPKDLCAEARNIASEIESAQLSRYHLVGHSMGAKLAYLTACELALTRNAPASLIVMGCRAPTIAARADETERPAAEMTDEELLDYLREMDGTPADVLNNRELLESVLPTVRADFVVNEAPLPHNLVQLKVPVLALGGTRDAYVAGEEIEPWRKVSSGPFSQRMLEGGHFFLETQRGQLLPMIRRFLDAQYCSA